MAPDKAKPGSHMSSTGPDLDSLAASDRQITSPHLQPQHDTERTREGLTQFELQMIYAVSDAISLAAFPKPTCTTWPTGQTLRKPENTLRFTEPPWSMDTSQHPGPDLSRSHVAWSTSSRGASNSKTTSPRCSAPRPTPPTGGARHEVPQDRSQNLVRHQVPIP